MLRIDSATTTPKVQVMKVAHKDWVQLQVESNTAGELHLHAYRLSWPLKANEAQTLRFQANSTGKFKLEWHAADKKTMAPTTSHAHAPPLASLEVMPR